MDHNTLKRKYGNPWATLSNLANVNQWTSNKRLKTGLFSHVQRYFSGESKMARTRGRFRRGRSRTITRTKRRRSFRRRRPIRRIWRFMRNKGLANVETKYITVAGNTGDIDVWTTSAAPPKIDFNDIDQGTGLHNRVGAKIFVKNIRFRAVVYAPNTAGADDEVYVRYMLVRDKQFVNATADPSLSDVIGEAPSGSATSDTNLFPWRYTNSFKQGRFQILKQGWAKVGRADGTAPRLTIVKFNKRLNLPMSWSGADGDTTKMKGMLYMFMWSNTTAVTPLMPHASWTYRLAFTDV